MFWLAGQDALYMQCTCINHTRRETVQHKLLVQVQGNNLKVGDVLKPPNSISTFYSNSISIKIIIPSCNSQLSQFSLSFHLNMVLFVTFTFTNTQRNETNLHWRLNPLESNASFLAEQSIKNLSSKIAAQLKAQL